MKKIHLGIFVLVILLSVILTGTVLAAASNQGSGPGQADKLFIQPCAPDGSEITLPATRLITGGPNIVVDSNSLEVTLLPGETAPLPLTITNVGDTERIQAMSEVFPSAAWSDDFDNYETGSSMHGQGGWKGWFNNPDKTAYTSDSQAVSAPNSVATRIASDLVHEFDGYTTGVWTYTAWQYIPSNFDGQSYFILLNQYNDDNQDINWSTQVLFDSVTGLVVNEGPAGGQLEMITGQWVKIRVDIDLDNDIQSFYYGGDLLFTGSWKDGLTRGGSQDIAAVDLWANGGTVIYYDNLSLGRLFETGADLRVLKASPATVGKGETFIYSLTVENLGPETAVNVTMTDTLPTSVTFSSATLPCANAEGVVTCALGEMIAGESTVIEIVVTAPQTTGSLTNVAVVTSEIEDPDETNNIDSINTVVAVETYLALVFKN